MAKKPPENAREKLIQAGTKLFRQCGYVAATVDDVCTEAGVTKGAFFHHFKSKEDLAEACLNQWECRVAAVHQNAPFQLIDDPVEKLLGAMHFFIQIFSQPKVFKSCLAGTTVQEVSETHPRLRKAAQACFVRGGKEFQKLLDAACRSRRIKLDTASLAELWMATIQGSLLLCKASRDDAVIPGNLRHVKNYIASLFNP